MIDAARPERAKRVEGHLALLALLALAACKNGSAEERARRSPPPPATRALAPPGELRVAEPGAVCLTRGDRDFDGARLRIDEPTVRLVAPASHGDAAAMRFTFHGDSDAKTALASGQVRRQLGLKLRAADGCNVVYVMWRLDPAAMIEVSTKVNPGARDHGDCGTRGYTKLKATRSAPPPPLRIGATHTLAAAIVGDELTARIGDEVVWRGRLPDAARTLAGPAGLRTDNVAVEAELLVSPISARHAVPGCD